MNTPRRTITPHLAGLALALGLAACGPVTAPATGAYGPSVARPAAVPGAIPAVAPSPVPGPIKIEPLAAPALGSAQPAVAERASPREHMVQPGETVYSIARRYNLSTADLMRANAIQPAFTIKAGQRLVLPHGGGATPAATEVTQGPPEAVRAESPAPVVLIPPVLVPPVLVPPPSVVLVPPPPPAVPAAQDAAPVPSVASVAPPSPSPAIPDLAYAPPIAPRGGDGSAEHAAERTTGHAASLAAATPPTRAGRAFQWPVKGRVISDYGSKGQGLRNDGINIAAPRGTPVLAAENGVVAYTGNELKGFGNLILIRHADGWVTAYAHNETLLVQRGETVKRGQPIARVGMTGNVREPQLHFELRRSRGAVDPAPHLDAEPGRAEGPATPRPSASRAGPPSPG
jgi:murein DD-endopeptidase MepM/ murein hydrolase activator NlpD